ncbi:uncharacterized protein C8R40DRAFT_1166815 [Lentinula edodes]|uniref:uncharacterized protein n=1 Tax=Lentinula edodes TaxID=5353 RepID=UPI001E8DE00D|nr:uncharacterized protein C8R40DRAFT_1166815 [Lentinula edodes]KAH7878832.1 hypothetical protein C8R40DRAFT_1166815 [Lentinula edodes]
MARTCVLLALLFTSTLSRYLPLFDDSESTEAIVASLSAPNHHGAPFPPGSFGSSAGWYYGDDPSSTLVDGLPWLKDKDLCAVLKQSPDAIQCPIVKAKPTKTYGRRSADATDSTATATTTPTPSYTAVFTDLDASIEGSGYITYGLVDTNSDCETFCNTVSNCIFLNSYYDVNGKDESPKLTCSLYSVVHTAAEATNKGGQTEPDGFMDYIANSSGYALVTS